MDSVEGLSESDKDKFNNLYKSIKDIPIPDFENTEAKQMGEDVKEGLGIINKAIKRVSQIIKEP
jgi:hypothetical protein